MSMNSRNDSVSMNSKNGSRSLSVFLAILFIASVALNAAFLTGCISPEDIRWNGKGTSQQGTKHSVPEASYLREIAAALGLSPSSDKTPGDIALDIEQVLKNSQAYKGDVFSDETFKECKAAIPTAKDTAIFEAYQAFIKKVAGKRILILESKE